MPSPTTSPILICGSAMNDFSDISTMSQSVAMVAPQPTAGPFTAAMMGIGTSMKLWMVRREFS
ncbi:hypothetical protein D3C85_1587700 [compost metagenome]